MATVLAILDPMKFPGADHVSPGEDGYAVYGAAVNGMHPAIAIIKKQPEGKLLIDAEPEVINKLGVITPVSIAEAAQKYPIYKTTVEVILPGRNPFTACHIGSLPKGQTLGGHKIMSIQPAIGWTLEKMRKMQSTIAKPVVDDEQQYDEQR